MDKASDQPGGLQRWMVCFLLAIPSLIPVALHCYYSINIANEHPSGFIQNDQPYYMANARQYFDDGSFSLTHKNPCDWRRNSPKIYVQPQTMLLGSMTHFTNIDPAVAFVTFGFVFAVLSIRVAWSLLDAFAFGQRFSLIVLVLMVWGGGLFAISGLITMLVSPSPELDFYDYITMHDPFEGWWFLNLGRNFIFPMESYYHFLFLSGSLALVKGKQWIAVALGLIISISHPFTGVEYLSVVFGWLFLERVFWKQQSIGWSLIVASAALLALHVGYYQVWLNQFPAHRQLHAAWELAWEYKATSMLLGYGLVAGLTIFTIRNVDLLSNFFSESKHRYLLVWFSVAFLLSNHEFFMKSLQPLHFTRGYVWLPLFLAGAVTLQRTLDFLSGHKLFRLFVPIVVVVFLLDNMMWLCVSTTDGKHNSIHSRTDFRQVMNSLNQISDPNVVVSNSRLLSYLSNVYSPHDAFASHGYLTPDVEEASVAIKRLYQNGKAIESLADYSQIVITDRHGDFLSESESPSEANANIAKTYAASGFDVQIVAETDDFAILRCTPWADSASDQ